MIKKLLILILACQNPVFANTFAWKSTNRVQTVDAPLAKISKLIEADMEKVIYTRTPVDLSNAVPPEVKLTALPAEVRKPQLPPSLKLTRGEFEPTADFNRRIRHATADRDKELHKLQEIHRKNVQLRNQKVEQLSFEYNNKVEQRNLILKRLQEIQKQDAQKLQAYFKKREAVALAKLDVFATDAVSKVFGQPKLTYRSYNADSRMMHLNLSSSDGENFKKPIAIRIAPDRARLLREKVTALVPSVIFDIEMGDKGEINFSLKDISLNFENTHYAATDKTTEYTFKPTYVTIDNVADFNAPGSKLKLQSSVDFKLQNPNLNDRKYGLSAVALTADGAIIGVNEQVNTIRSLPSVKTDEKKWLFMIAIENYIETDNVLYARRSADAIKAVLQKRLGVSQKNTYVLFDEKATSGAIKDKMRSMIARVKKGDSIYFYYSGHGIPSKSGDAYILPSDMVVDFIDEDPFFKLENIYARFSKSRAEHSFAFIDACFSGKTDDVLVFKGVAAGLIRTKKTPYDVNKMTIITAGMDDEFSNMYEDKRYRLFSYYLTQALIKNISDASLLYKKVNVNVLQRSRERGSRYEQNPQIYGNKKVRLF